MEMNLPSSRKSEQLESRVRKRFATSLDLKVAHWSEEAVHLSLRLLPWGIKPGLHSDALYRDDAGEDDRGDTCGQGKDHREGQQRQQSNKRPRARPPNLHDVVGRKSRDRTSSKRSSRSRPFSSCRLLRSHPVAQTQLL